MSNIQIQVLSVSVETKPTAKGSYQQAEIAYKNLTFQGKVESKKIMSFTNKEVYTTLSIATMGNVFNVEVVKDDKGYNQWVKVEKGESVATSVAAPSTPRATAGSASVTSSPKGTWETPEERAKKQIYIVRQSSLTAAISTLTAGRKTELKPEDVIELASRYEAFVFGNGDVHNVVAQDVVAVPGFEDLESDLPF